MPVTPRSHPHLGFPSHGSIAVGTVTNGYLVDGAELPLVGAHHRVLPQQAGRRMNYGSDEAVGLILHAATAVDRAHPGAVLGVGNVAKGGGGDVPWSVSHNTGLDFDLSFYFLDGGTCPARPDALLHVDSEGHCVEQPAWTVDVPRTWALVAALLSSRRAAVQYVFIAEHIRQRLLRYAKTTRVAKRLRRRAEEVLRQPRGALPHDDHMHVRLFCPRDDLLEGCRNRGPQRAWRPVAGGSLKARIRKLQRWVSNGSEARRADAIRLLTLLRIQPELRALKAALGSESSRALRAAAHEAVRALRIERVAPALGRLLRSEDDEVERWELATSLAALRGNGAAKELSSFVDDERPARRVTPQITLASETVGAVVRRASPLRAK